MKNHQLKALKKSAKNLASKLLTASFLLLSINLISCKSTQTQKGISEISKTSENPQTKTNQSENSKLKTSSPENSTENFSHNTIIVYLENETSQKEIISLAKKYNLQILYIYKNFSACALSSTKTLNTSELNSLISTLESEPKVLSVQKDYIMTLD